MKKRSLVGIVLVAFELLGLGVSTAMGSWLIGEKKSKDAPATIYGDPICINETSSTSYFDLLKAVEIANARASSATPQTITVFPGQTITIDSRNLSLASYVTLNLPFVQEAENYICDQTDTSKLGNYPGGRISQINMRKGYDIEIASHATLNVGGTFSTTGNNGKYCELNLGKGSSITVFGTVNCYGFVREDKSDAVGFFEDERKNLGNGNDTGRQITVKSGAQFNTFMSIREGDAMGGSAMSNALSKGKLCPFNVWDFNSIQTYLSVECGGICCADAVLDVAGTIARRQANVISTGSAEAILLLQDGATAAIEYCPKDPEKLDNSIDNHYTNVTLKGIASIGSIYIEGMAGYNLDTSKCFMPFGYNFRVYVDDGAICRFGYKVKFLPGSKMEICRGGEVINTSELVFYQESQCPEHWNYPASCGDATFIVNGKFTCSGKIGAFIQTESASEDGAELDFTNSNSSSNFSVTSVETTGYVDVRIDSRGHFLFDNKVSESTFLAQKSYKSGDPTKGYYWKGDTVTSREINVSIASTEYSHPISSYTLSSSDTASGTKSEIISSSSAYSTTIAIGKYLTVSWPRAASATITNAGVSVDTSGKTAITFLPNGNVSVVITPSEGVTIYTSYGQNLWQKEYPSGAGDGHTIITECATQNGQFTQIADLIGGNQIGQTYVVKNRYFKVTVTEGAGASDIDHKYYWKPEDIDNKWTPTGRQNHSASTPYHAYGDYAFYWEWKVQSWCLPADSVITLWDGSTKRAADLTLEDKLLTFNHFTGSFEPQKSSYLVAVEAEEFPFIELSFSDGYQLSVVSGHGLFNMTTQNYEIYYGDEFKDHIGESFAALEYVNGKPVIKTVVLESVAVSMKKVAKFSPLSEYAINCFADGMLTIADDIEGMLDAYKYLPDLTIDLNEYEKDLEQYGEFSYETVQDVMPRYIYDVYRASYWKIAIMKGNLTFDKVNHWMQFYVPEIMRQHGVEWDMSNWEPLSTKHLKNE